MDFELVFRVLTVLGLFCLVACLFVTPKKGEGLNRENYSYKGATKCTKR